MKTFIWISLIAAGMCLDARAGEPGWNNGHVILSNGQVIKGQLSYNWKAEVLQVRADDGTTKAYSAYKVDSFAYFDVSQNMLRKFDAIEIPTASELTRPVFLEECTIGHYTVYRRLRHTKELIKITRPSLYQEDIDLIKDLDNFVYFVVDTNGDISDLQAFELSIWPQMLSEYRPQLTEYITLRQLDPSLTMARLMLINHYNYLREYNPSQANKPATSLGAY
ncbi:hypothetical protein ACAW74_27090 [Fibrella sp. WM1]|uniref:hypothetical protein n=1 Tax=Fibrella musci TaxID=3242485 RepID=UPI0035222599